MRAWEGPRRQYLGGIQSNYNWRNIDPLRPTSLLGRRSGGQYEEDEEGNLIRTTGGRRSRGESPQKEQAVSPYSSGKTLTVDDPNNVIGNAWVDQQVATQPASWRPTKDPLLQAGQPGVKSPFDDDPFAPVHHYLDAKMAEDPTLGIPSRAQAAGAPPPPVRRTGSRTSTRNTSGGGYTQGTLGI